MNGNNVNSSYNTVYFDSFGVEHIPKQLKKLIGNKNIIFIFIEYDNVWDMIMCGCLSIEFINFMLKGKGLLDYKNMRRMIKIILNYLQ